MVAGDEREGVHVQGRGEGDVRAALARGLLDVRARGAVARDECSAEAVRLAGLGLPGAAADREALAQRGQALPGVRGSDLDGDVDDAAELGVANPAGLGVDAKLFGLLRKCGVCDDAVIEVDEVK